MCICICAGMNVLASSEESDGERNDRTGVGEQRMRSTTGARDRCPTMCTCSSVMTEASTQDTRANWLQGFTDTGEDEGHGILGCADRKGLFTWRDLGPVAPR
jgi:hypothetical protein